METLKQFEKLLEAYEEGIEGIEDELIALHNDMTGVRVSVKREDYIYNSLNADPNMFNCVTDGAYEKAHFRFLEENNNMSEENISWYLVNRILIDEEIKKVSTDFADYLFHTLENGWNTINFQYHTNADKEKGFFDGFCFHSNYLDHVIMDYCRLHTKFDITNFPIMNIDNWEFNKMGIYNRLDMKSFVYEHAYKYPEYNFYAHLQSIAARNIIRRLKDQRVGFSKKDNIAFIEDTILSYETVMIEHKKLVAPTLSILVMWNVDADNKNDSDKFEKYLEGAKKAVLRLDEQFLELKEKFCKKARISDNELFKGNQKHYEDIIKREKLKYIGIKLNLYDKKWDPLLTFEPYQYSYDEYFAIKRSIVKNYEKKYDVSNTLFYYDKYMNTWDYVITKDYLYTVCFSEPIALKGLVCCKMGEYKQLTLLYEDGTKKVITYSLAYELKTMKGIIWFLNRILIYF